MVFGGAAVRVNLTWETNSADFRKAENLNQIKDLTKTTVDLKSAGSL